MSTVLEQSSNAATIFDELKELEASRDGLQVLINQAQSELDEAKAKQKLTGEYANPEWFAKTRQVIREETIELHNINRKIKTLRSQRSRSNPKAAFFQDAARKLLSTEKYNEINALANTMMKN
jgi:hypothetical protein